MTDATRLPAKRSRAKRDPVKRFLAKVDKNGPVPAHRPELGPCWLWTKSTTPSGYGQFFFDGKLGGAHRFAHLHFNGPIPAGWDVDHLCHPGDGSCPRQACDHHRCVNPAHLEAVPHFMNVARGASPSAENNRVTACPAGHEYTPENTALRTGPTGRKRRECRECRRVPEGDPRRYVKGSLVKCVNGHEYTPENTYIEAKTGSKRCLTCMKDSRHRAYLRRKAKANT
jgi:hypothetical protein